MPSQNVRNIYASGQIIRFHNVPSENLKHRYIGIPEILTWIVPEFNVCVFRPHLNIKINTSSFCSRCLAELLSLVDLTAMTNGIGIVYVCHWYHSH